MKTKRTVVLVVLGMLAAARVRAGDTNQDMIRKVENGLFREIQIGAQSPMNLEERIKTLKAPGLSIAVVKDFQVQWSKGYGVRDSRTAAPIWVSILPEIEDFSQCSMAMDV